VSAKSLATHLQAGCSKTHHPGNTGFADYLRAVLCLEARPNLGQYSFARHLGNLGPVCHVLLQLGLSNGVRSAHLAYDALNDRVTVLSVGHFHSLVPSGKFARCECMSLIGRVVCSVWVPIFLPTPHKTSPLPVKQHIGSSSLLDQPVGMNVGGRNDCMPQVVRTESVVTIFCSSTCR